MRDKAKSGMGRGMAKRSTDMITRTKQNWDNGSIVKVGFMTLRVLSVRAVFDGLPDIYTLESLDRSIKYEFIPHNGLTRLNP